MNLKECAHAHVIYADMAAANFEEIEEYLKEVDIPAIDEYLKNLSTERMKKMCEEILEEALDVLEGRISEEQNEPKKEARRCRVEEYLEKVDIPAIDDEQMKKIIFIKFEKEDIVSETLSEIIKQQKKCFLCENNHFTPEVCNKIFFN